MRPSQSIRLLLFLALTVIPTAGGHAQNGTQPAKPKDMTVPAVVTAVRHSVVTILTRGVPLNAAPHSSPTGSGSGFIIDSKGYILTNNHLVEGVKSLVVGLSTGRLTPGRVVARDFLLDLAVVKISAPDLVAAPLGESSSLQIGEQVVAIGNPFALKGGSTVTVGVVSAMDRSILAPNNETLYDLIQTDAAINPGNSGGPLVDLSGRVVGINTAVAPSAQSISYAISIDAAYPYIQSMLLRGMVLRPELGFVPITVTPSVVASFNLDIDRGVLAAQLDPSKLISRLGIQSGNVITAVDNLEIYNMGDFWHAYLRQGDNNPAQLTVFGKKGSFTIALPRQPSQPETR
ncbi:MAG: S1C family serine protease [Nitrospira sp.]|nr:trypsin-like serine protease [Nitrospira sp.]